MPALAAAAFAAGAAILALGVVGIARIPGLRDAIVAGWHCIA
jgi:energy-converting hydrogenase Eha subunit E